jgi:hypothetical protein
MAGGIFRLRCRAFSLRRPNRGPGGLVRTEIRKPSFGIQFAFTSGVEITNQGGNNNANRDTRKNNRSS